MHIVFMMEVEMERDTVKQCVCLCVGLDQSVRNANTDESQASQSLSMLHD